MYKIKYLSSISLFVLFSLLLIDLGIVWYYKEIKKREVLYIVIDLNIIF